MEKNYLTIEQLEKRLNRKKSSIYQWIRQGMPCYTHPIRGKVFLIDEVDAFFDSKIMPFLTRSKGTGTKTVKPVQTAQKPPQIRPQQQPREVGDPYLDKRLI